MAIDDDELVNATTEFMVEAPRAKDKKLKAKKHVPKNKITNAHNQQKGKAMRKMEKLQKKIAKKGLDKAKKVPLPMDADDDL